MIKDEAEMTDHCSQNENVFSKGVYLEGVLHGICGRFPLHPSLVNPELFRELLVSALGCFLTQAREPEASSKLWLC